jgi:hypothetical protein
MSTSGTHLPSQPDGHGARGEAGGRPLAKPDPPINVLVRARVRLSDVRDVPQ